jgi:hypothetical protein
MGLDMYLLKAPKTAEKPEHGGDEVAYWRKFNALHNWFVTNIQIGIDDCGSYEITKDELEALISTIESLLETRDPDFLPPTSGFFFGSMAIDDYYFEQCEWTLEKLKSILETFDWENEKLFYASSW